MITLILIIKIKVGYKVGYLKTKKPRKQFVYVAFYGALQGTRKSTFLYFYKNQYCI